MNTASPQLFIPINKSEIQEYFSKSNEERVDTNIAVITFNFLKENFLEKLSCNKPYFCEECGAALNFSSKIMENNAEKPTKHHIWKCEFCDFVNFFDFEHEEKPDSKDPIYLLEGTLAKKEEDSKEEEENIEKTESTKGEKLQQQEEKDISMIFCLDTSGSMCNKEGIHHLSRSKCVINAIKTSLTEMIKAYPNRKIGLVLFSNEVRVYGDCFQKPKIFSSHQDFSTYYLSGKTCYSTHFTHSLQESCDKIFNALDNIEESGCTSLGPALLLSTSILSQAKNGGSIILCTDGLANNGLGSLKDERNPQSTEFYKKISNLANENGISINITTIKGEECKIDVLAELTDNTNGIINRVNPDELTQNFRSLSEQKIVTNKAEIKIFLHKALTMRNLYQEDYLNVKDKFYQKNFAVINENCEIQFEYDLKPTDDETLEYYSNVIKAFPLQVQITFQQNECKFLKILTVLQNISNKKDEVEQKASIRMLKKTATFKTCMIGLKKKKIFDSTGFYVIAEKSAKLSESTEDKKALEEFKLESNNLEELLMRNRNQKKINVIGKRKFYSSTLNSKNLEKNEIKVWKTPLDSIFETRNSIDTNLDMNDELAMELIKIRSSSSYNDEK